MGRHVNLFPAGFANTVQNADLWPLLEMTEVTLQLVLSQRVGDHVLCGIEGSINGGKVICAPPNRQEIIIATIACCIMPLTQNATQNVVLYTSTSKNVCWTVPVSDCAL